MVLNNFAIPKKGYIKYVMPAKHVKEVLVINKTYL